MNLTHLLLVAGSFAICSAQWLNYKEPATPRQRDGRPNLAASAPEGHDGKPDLSGVWQVEATPLPEMLKLFGPEVVAIDVPGDSSDLFSKYVVSALAFSVKSWLDLIGHPRSEGARITERYLRRDFGHMNLEIKVEDPKYYTRPFSFKVSLNLLPDTDVLESVCNENERDTRHFVH